MNAPTPEATELTRPPLAIPRRRTDAQKVALIVCDKTRSRKVLDLALSLRLWGIPVNIWWGKSVKSQIGHAKKNGYSNLVYVDDSDSFQYQDTHEYPQWLCDEYGTVNFEKRRYYDVTTLIHDELLLSSIGGFI